MIGYKFPQGLKRPDVIRKAFEACRNEDMTLEFNIAPKTEEDQPRLQWFEQNCPNQFIADCIRRVVRRIQGLGQAAYINEKNPSKFLFFWGESIKVAAVFKKWAAQPEVHMALLQEKEQLEAQAEEWDFKIELQELEQDIMKAPAEQKESNRPYTAEIETVTIEMVVENLQLAFEFISMVAGRTVGLVDRGGCGLQECMAAIGHTQKCLTSQANMLKGRLSPVVTEAPKLLPREESEEEEVPAQLPPGVLGEQEEDPEDNIPF